MENVLATTNASPLERKKPLIKDFFDRDAEIIKHLSLRLPHVAKAKSKISRLFTSKDGLTHKYRANWYSDKEDSIMTVKQLVFSQYIEVITTKEGQVVSFNIR